jgi:GNAT superfamily N-acetyltransferase
VTDGDVDLIRWALYEALAWNPKRELPARDAVLAHPEASRYHVGWGRRGDIGVVATADDETVGVAYCRLFTDADHGHGFVDDRTPEVAVAVRDGWRGTGLGTRLMNRLANAARTAGFQRLSLSVDTDNPARRLYERLGYREVSVDDGGVRMLLELSPRVSDRKNRTRELSARPAPDANAVRDARRLAPRRVRRAGRETQT